MDDIRPVFQNLRTRGIYVSVSEETIPCEWCEEVRVPLKDRQPCANCRERFERTGSYYKH